MDKAIIRFRGKNNFLSNMHTLPVPIQVELDNKLYKFKSVENAYQACKASRSLYRYFEYHELMEKFERCSPPESKRMGSHVYMEVSKFDRVEIMRKLLELKFQIPQMKELLQQTCEVKLYEGNSWGDKFWGVNQVTLEGKNMLGKLLMQIRDGVKQEQEKIEFV